MPALGESVTEGTVTRWLKQVGDTIEVDEPLLEVSTDKVDTEIPSPTSGTPAGRASLSNSPAGWRGHPVSASQNAPSAPHLLGGMSRQTWSTTLRPESHC